VPVLLGANHLDCFPLAHDRTGERPQDQLRADCKPDFFLHTAPGEYASAQKLVGKVSMEAIAPKLLMLEADHWRYHLHLEQQSFTGRPLVFI
jgi:hypothetical protein